MPPPTDEFLVLPDQVKHKGKAPAAGGPARKKLRSAGPVTTGGPGVASPGGLPSNPAPGSGLPGSIRVEVDSSDSEETREASPQPVSVGSDPDVPSFGIDFGRTEL